MQLCQHVSKFISTELVSGHDIVLVVVVLVLEVQNISHVDRADLALAWQEGSEGKSRFSSNRMRNNAT